MIMKVREAGVLVQSVEGGVWLQGFRKEESSALGGWAWLRGEGG
jgi:hypothetical protein